MSDDERPEDPVRTIRKLHRQMGEHLETVRAALESGDMDTVRDELDSFDFNAADTAIREALTVLG